MMITINNRTFNSFEELKKAAKTDRTLGLEYVDKVVVKNPDGSKTISHGVIRSRGSKMSINM